jgi:hypothetical protein
MHVDQNHTINNNTFKILHTLTTFLVHSSAINHFPTWNLILFKIIFLTQSYKLNGI